MCTTKQQNNGKYHFNLRNTILGYQKQNDVPNSSTPVIP